MICQLQGQQFTETISLPLKSQAACDLICSPGVLDPLKDRLDPMSYLALRSSCRGLRAGLPPPKAETERGIVNWQLLCRATKPILFTSLKSDEWWKIWSAINRMGPMRDWDVRWSIALDARDSNRPGIGDHGYLPEQWVVRSVFRGNWDVAHHVTDESVRLTFRQTGLAGDVAGLWLDTPAVIAPYCRWAYCLAAVGTQSLFAFKTSEYLSICFVERESWLRPRVTWIIKKLMLSETEEKNLYPVLWRGEVFGFLQIGRPARPDFRFFAPPKANCTSVGSIGIERL